MSDTRNGNGNLPHDPYAALRIPNYRLFAASQLITVIASQIQQTALTWEAYLVTGSASSIAMVAGSQALPTMLLTLPAGYLADRFSRKRILFFTLFVSLICASALAWLSHSHGAIEWMYIVTMIRSTANVFARAARGSLLPQMVPISVFPNAVTWNSTFFQFALMSGPFVGGAILPDPPEKDARALTNFTLGGIREEISYAYLVDAACLLFSLISISLVKEPSQSKRDEAASLDSVLAGIRFVHKTKVILAAITLDLFAVLVGGCIYLMPIFAKDILNTGGFGLGALRAAPAVGAVVIAIILTHRPPIQKAGPALLWSVAGFGLATIVFAYSTNYFLSWVMLFLTGAFDNVSVVIRHTLVQMLAPDEMRGRVTAVNQLFIGASNDLGGVESGVAADLLGTQRSVAFGGIGAVLFVLLVNYTWPQLRKVGALNELKPPD